MSTVGLKTAPVPVREHQRRPRAPVALRSYFALVDESTFNVAGEPEGDALLIDAIEEESVKETIAVLQNWTPFNAREVLLAALQAWRPSLFSASRTAFLKAYPNALRSGWLRMKVSSERGVAALTPVRLGTTPDQGVDLADGRPDASVWLSGGVKPVSKRLANDLARVENLALAPARQFADLAALEPHSKAAAFAAVFDVGQANCNALVDSEGRPLLFFDLGWPWAATATPPGGSPELLHGNSAPVLLSHWDFDHWTLALEKTAPGTPLRVKPETLSRDWYAPEVRPEHRLGPTHLAFVMALTAAGRLQPLKYLPAAAPLTSGALTLIQCSPASKGDGDRNNSGLALLADLPKFGKVLFTGDADYQSIRRGHAGTLSDLTALVLPHHGGETPSDPPTVVSRPCFAAVSAHERSPYHHPRSPALLKCFQAGWSLSMTFDRVALAPSHTAVGHKLLALGGVNLLGPAAPALYGGPYYSRS